MYGLMALGFYVTYAVSGTVNFAQGSSMMLGAVLTFTFAQTLGWPIGSRRSCWRCCCARCTACWSSSSRCGRSCSRGSDAWLMATVALGIVLDNVVLFTFGKEPRSLPSPLAQTPLELGGVGLGVYPLQLLIPVVGLALAAALHALSRRTRWGTAMLAVVQNRVGRAADGHPDPARRGAGASRCRRCSPASPAC